VLLSLTASTHCYTYNRTKQHTSSTQGVMQHMLKSP
jgi:hypothetical protein